jgi:hypothetical protein
VTGLVLASAGLCSKWGFNDGDMPDVVCDALEEAGHLPDDWPDWHDVLSQLVETYLLPEMRKHHQVETYRISTNHNPIRAARIDGYDVDSYDDDDWHHLAPEWVEVPLEDVLTICTGADS